MSKSFFAAVGLLYFTISALVFSAVAQTSDTGLTYNVVSKIPMMLDAVSSSSVCGSVKSKPNSRQCLGTNEYEIFTNNTVSKLEQFVLGGRQMCAVDERGPQCWSSNGRFEKPVQELLARGDAKRAQLSDENICVPHADRTIHCYHPEMGSWVDSTPGTGKKDKFLLQMPPVEIFGPFKDLRDFDSNGNALCALDGESVVCTPFKYGTTGVVPMTPKRTFPGAKELVTTWNSICVLSSEGLDCTRGTTVEGLETFHLGGKWKNAVRLFERGYNAICGVDKDQTPMCVQLGNKSEETTDRTPLELLKPEIRVLKFKAYADVACALVETRETKQRSFLCGALEYMVATPIADDIVDFDLTSAFTCTVSAKGVINCFHGTVNMDSPLQEDGSAAKSAGRCRWNDSRFHCASTDIKTDFSEIAKVIATTSPQNTNLPCVIFDDRTAVRKVRCFDNGESLSKNTPTLDRDMTAVTASARYACVYGGANTACWGEPLGGAQPPNLSNVKKIAFGNDFGCARDEFGFVCWGTKLDTRQLTVPEGLGDIDSVGAFGVGHNHACAISRDKQVICWGENSVKQTDVPPLTNPTSLFVSGDTNCASSDEGVTCWGRLEPDLSGKARTPSTQFSSEMMGSMP